MSLSRSAAYAFAVCALPYLAGVGTLAAQEPGPAPPATPAAVQAPAQPYVPAGPPPLTPAQQEDKRRVLARARSVPAEVTTASADERMEAWKMVLIIDPNDTEAKLAYERAQRDLDGARAQEVAQKQAQDAEARARAAQGADRREKLALAERALYARDLNSAEQIVVGVLAQSPDDPRALSLRDAIRQGQDARRFTRRLMMAAGALLGLAAVIAVLVKKLGGKTGGAGAGSGAAAPRAIVKVIDGVGRGRLAPVEREIFRIGAADGERPEEKNDLIISDASALVSRYHCTILRKGRDYFLLDSSMNGTRLNGTPLARGEHHALEDGDEFVVAGAARLKFLHT